MVRSAPPPNVSLPEVTTAPLIAASAATLSTISLSSAITDWSITFIERPGMSQVMSAMPSPSTSSLKLVMFVSPKVAASVRFAGFVQDAHDTVVALEFQIAARIVRAFALRARADLEQQHVALRAVHDAVAVRHVRLPAGAVTGLERDLAALFDQHALALQDVDELVLLFVPVKNRRGRAGLQLREVHAELRQADRIAERGLMAARADVAERRRIVRRTDAGFERDDVDLGHCLVALRLSSRKSRSDCPGS